MFHVDEKAFDAIVKATLGPGEQGYRDGTKLGEADATALVGIAYLMLDADDRENPEELEVVEEVAQRVNALTGAQVSAPAVRATDDFERVEQLRALAGELSSVQVRELAYALAYLIVVADFELAPAESELLSDLAVALEIPDERSDELAVIASQAVTPAG